MLTETFKEGEIVEDWSYVKEQPTTLTSVFSLKRRLRKIDILVSVQWIGDTQNQKGRHLIRICMERLKNVVDLHSFYGLCIICTL